MTRELEILNCPLSGRVLIEASAGAGKTWSICALIVRLVLEKHLEIRQILVLTFTRAATAELKMRVHARLEEAFHYATDALPADPLLAALFTRLESEGQARTAMAARLKQALSSFDEAAIFTMHGFCKRTLADMPLLSHQPLAMNFNEEGESGDKLLIEVAADFWRRRILFGDESPLFLRYLNERKFSPENLKQLALRHIERPLAEARWPEDFATLDEATLQKTFATAARLWQSEKKNIFSLLAEKIREKSLSAVSYKANKLPLWQNEWQRYFATDLPEQTFAAMKYLSASHLAGKSNKGHEPPQHPFFGEAEKLCEWDNSCQRFCEARLSKLQRDFVEFFPAALAELKRRQRHLDFNDMLRNVHQALTGERGKALAKQLAKTYPAALIDEFQDTDPLQYAIFQAIYTDTENSALFFVGDPKQAIYSFRQADLPTYFAARKTVRPEKTFGLNHNQRSKEGVLAGINAIFSAQAHPFMLEDLNFPLATRGEKPLPLFADESGIERPAFSFWQPPETRQSDREVGQWAAEITAAEIARLLAEASSGKIRVNNEPLRARRIAVLVRTNKEGKEIKQALAAVGVRSVELSLASAYKSEIATELASVLAAMLVPRDVRRIKAALATRLFGFSALDISGLNNNEPLLAEQISRFARLQRLWQEKGILAALAALDLDAKLSCRLLTLPDGERSLTDYLHLQELLHGEERNTRLSPERLFEALALALHNPPGGEATQIRLESGRDLVRIVTIHKAKGLEYDFVFCPFLWKNHRPPPNILPGEIYHDPRENEAYIIDYRPENAEVGKQLAKQEQAEESLRLIYVALTRAVLRCYLVCHPTPANSLLNWLAAGGQETPSAWLGKNSMPDEAAIRAAWQRVAEAAGGMIDTPSIPERVLADVASATPVISPTIFPVRSIHSDWRMESFSGLVRGASWSGEEQEHDAASFMEEALPALDEDFLPAHDILHFPKGARAGDCIHAFFEQIEFTDPATFLPAAARALQTHPQLTPHATEAAKERALARQQAQLLRLAEDVLATPLPLLGETPLCLKQLPEAKRLCELAFHLPARHLDPARLGRIIADAGEPLPELAAPLLKGYLKGFIDLVFEHEERYYILDWKSNHLGWRQSDYAATRLLPVMQEHGYYLQARLYMLALHRYLRARLPDYDPARHLGGACYLFIRGVRPEWISEGKPTGFCWLPPKHELLSTLELELGG